MQYNAGKCVNLFKQYFPNFVYTFYWALIDKLAVRLISSAMPISSKDIKPPTQSNVPTPIPIPTPISFFTTNDAPASAGTIEKGCLSNDQSGVLIEYLPNSISFGTFLLELDQTNRNTEIFNAYFQTYIVLFTLRYNFTHYDLHPENIMVIKLDEPHYVEYDIKVDNVNKKFRIVTKYIPVIIDYGRAYFNYEGHKSIDIIKKACNNNCNTKKLPECHLDNYGINAGYDKIIFQ